jgi:hypothetical protein
VKNGNDKPAYLALQDRLHEELEYRKEMMKVMESHYLSCEVIGLSRYRLDEIHYIIQREKEEIECLERRLNVLRR